MHIRKYEIKNHKKTETIFNSEDECVNFMIEQLKDNNKAQKMLYDMPIYDVTQDQDKIIEFLLKVFKKINGTNAILERNSPIKITFNGWWEFKVCNTFLMDEKLCI